MSIYGGGFFSLFSSKKQLTEHNGGNDKTFFGIASGSNGCWLNSYLQAFKNIPNIDIVVEKYKNQSILYNLLYEFFTEKKPDAGNKKATEIYDNFYRIYKENFNQFGEFDESEIKKGEQQDYTAFKILLEDCKNNNNLINDLMSKIQSGRDTGDTVINLGISKINNNKLFYLTDNNFYNLQKFLDVEIKNNLIIKDNIMFNFRYITPKKIYEVTELIEFINSLNDEEKKTLKKSIKKYFIDIFNEFIKLDLEKNISNLYFNTIIMNEEGGNKISLKPKDEQKDKIQIINSKNKDISITIDDNNIYNKIINIRKTFKEFKEQLINICIQILDNDELNNNRFDELFNMIDKYITLTNDNNIFNTSVITNIKSKFYFCYIILCLLVNKTPSDIESVISKYNLDINFFSEIINNNYKLKSVDREKIILPPCFKINGSSYFLKSIVYHSNAQKITTSGGHYVSLVFPNENYKNGIYLNDQNLFENNTQEDMNKSYFPVFWIYSKSNSAYDNLEEKKEVKTPANISRTIPTELQQFFTNFNLQNVKDNDKVIITYVFNVNKYYLNKLTSWTTETTYKKYGNTNNLSDQSITYNIYELFKTNWKNDLTIDNMTDFITKLIISNNLKELTIYLLTEDRIKNLVFNKINEFDKSHKKDTKSSSESKSTTSSLSPLKSESSSLSSKSSSSVLSSSQPPKSESSSLSSKSSLSVLSSSQPPKSESSSLSSKNSLSVLSSSQPPKSESSSLSSTASVMSSEVENDVIDEIKNIIKDSTLAEHKKIGKITIILKSNKSKLDITEDDVDELENSTTLPDTWKLIFNESTSIPNNIKDLIKTMS